jgi:cytochrome c-type biogenesis protein CcmE
MKSNKIFFILVLTAVVVVLSVTLLTTTQTSSAVLTPSDLKKESSVQRVRIAGKVSKEGIEYQVKPTFRLKFFIEDRSAKSSSQDRVQVIYDNIKPDMFIAGRDVLVDGDYDEGVLSASHVLTQCPSKYEPAIPDATKSK